MQALSRTTGYVVSRNSKYVRAVKSTYIRNGTQNLFAALQIATGQVFGKATATKKRVDFLAFMAKGCRCLVVENYLVFFVVKDDTVQNRRILYGKRNYEWLL